MTEHTQVPPKVVAKLRTISMKLPDVYEEQAWVGTRWMIRKKNFAHVVMIDGGWPPMYASAAANDGPLVVLTFRSSGEELAALVGTGHPFFKPVWFNGIVGMALDAKTDWKEVTELLTESYCILAPKKLAEQVRGERRTD
jgi:hypothetical protein